MCPSCQATSAPQAHDWHLPILLWGSSSSASGLGHTIPDHNGDTFAAIAHLGVGILYCQTCGNDPSLARGARVITFNLTPVYAVFVLACMILDEKASVILLSLVVTISLYSVGSNILVATLLSSTMAAAHCTAKR